MTICVSVKVSEGLVLAADSTAAIEGQLGDGQRGILKTYDYMRKLVRVKDYPIGILTWGTAHIGMRTVGSLIREFEYTLPSLQEEEEKCKEQRMRGEKPEPYKYSVRAITEGVVKFIGERYRDEFGNRSKEEGQPLLGLLVSGYSSSQFFPEQWLVEIPLSSDLRELRPDKNEKPDFGANWFGMTDAIVRLHWGRDDQALSILSERFEVSREEVGKILESLQYPVIFEGMPLQDAIDYAIYVVNVVIGRFRFVIGAPLCGGAIDVAVITPESFAWIKQKSWEAGD
jgi:hypothetical protein